MLTFLLGSYVSLCPVPSCDYVIPRGSDIVYRTLEPNSTIFIPTIARN